MPQRKPSEILASLSSSLPADTFLNLLKKNLYPALDCLSDAPLSNILSILESVEKDHKELAKLIALIDYDGTCKDLQDQLKALNKHVKRDWHDRAENQCEMMQRIAITVIQWLPVLWTVGVENGVEIPLVHKCLKLCNDIVSKVYACGSRAEFSDVDGEVSIIIKNKSGQEVYSDRYSGIYTAIAWLWRELLMSTMIHDQDDCQVKAMIDDIHRLGFMNDVEQQLREDSAGLKTMDEISFHDEHWSEDMLNVAGQLKKLFSAKRMLAFQNDPSYNIYRSLVSASPELKDSLLETSRNFFFQDTDARVSWSHALRIFKDARANDDIVQVLESTRNVSVPKTTHTTVRHDAISYLMMQSDYYRSKARIHLEADVAYAEKTLWNELEDIFPGLDEAYDFLDQKLEAKKITKRQRASKGPFDSDRKRDSILDKFVEIARSGADRSSDTENYEYEQRMDCIEENDSDYKEICEAFSPDIAGAIRGLIAILHKWPDAAEAGEMRKKFSGGEDLLYTVDGVADVLARRCDWDWKHNNARVHVAEGIRAAYVAFGPDGPAKDQMR